MKGFLPRKLLELAEICPAPLYVVGGSVRDFAAGFPMQGQDFDLSAPLSAEDFARLATRCGLIARAVYKNTGTVKFSDGEGGDYEFTSFRSDRYVRGIHTPVEIFFTNDITADAKRRDFCMNAVYYDIKQGLIVDPLGGVQDIQKRTIRTVDRPEKVFGEDGLRLMRLARQAGQTGFTPDEACLLGAKKNAALIRDIVPERIAAELKQILYADEKYGNRTGHYDGLRILEETGVLQEILPELQLGKGMAQRADFHDHDVLEHSLRALLYAEKSVRLAALLHDVGKPFCQNRDGNSHAHPEEGARLTEEILSRLKFPKAETQKTAKLVSLHMYDFDGRTKESKLRRFLVDNARDIEPLLALKQADFSACKDDLSTCPTAVRWRALLAKMQEEGVPFSLKDLKIKGDALAECGIEKPYLSDVLRALLLHVAVFPKENEAARLKTLAVGFYNHLKKYPKEKRGRKL